MEGTCKKGFHVVEGWGSVNISSKAAINAGVNAGYMSSIPVRRLQANGRVWMLESESRSDEKGESSGHDFMRCWLCREG